MTDKPPSDLAHPVDLYVGARLRIRRKVLGLSQTQLAEALGLDETSRGDVDDGFAQRMTQFVATPEGLELAGLFPRLNDRRLRRRVVDLVKAMVDDEPATATS
jgi:hypothetical protein